MWTHQDTKHSAAILSLDIRTTEHTSTQLQEPLPSLFRHFESRYLNGTTYKHSVAAATAFTVQTF